MNIDIVDYYFDKIIIYSIENNKYELIKNNELLIRDEIKKIIDSNNDYLFTESFLNYLTLDSNMLFSLKALYSKKDSDKISVLCNYYQDIITEYKIKKISPDITVDRFVDIQDNITKDITSKAYSCVNHIFNEKGIINYKSLTFKRIVFIVLSYCHIYDRFNDFQELCNMFINNPNKILDDIYINSVKESDDAFINRVLIELNKGSKKLIK